MLIHKFPARSIWFALCLALAPFIMHSNTSGTSSARAVESNLPPQLKSASAPRARAVLGANIHINPSGAPTAIDTRVLGSNAPAWLGENLQDATLRARTAATNRCVGSTAIRRSHSVRSSAMLFDSRQRLQVWE